MALEPFRSGPLHRHTGAMFLTVSLGGLGRARYPIVRKAATRSEVEQAPAILAIKSFASNTPAEPKNDGFL